MKKATIALVKDMKKTRATDDLPGGSRETAVSDEWLFSGEDEAGRRGWWIRVSVTGLYTRRFGPFVDRATALAHLEQFLDGVLREPMIDLENEMTSPQYWVLEGVQEIVPQRRQVQS